MSARVTALGLLFLTHGCILPDTQVIHFDSIAVRAHHQQGTGEAGRLSVRLNTAGGACFEDGGSVQFDEAQLAVESSSEPCGMSNWILEETGWPAPSNSDHLLVEHQGIPVASGTLPSLLAPLALQASSLSVPPGGVVTVQLPANEQITLTETEPSVDCESEICPIQVSATQDLRTVALSIPEELPPGNARLRVEVQTVIAPTMEGTRTATAVAVVTRYFGLTVLSE